MRSLGTTLKLYGFLSLVVLCALTITSCGSSSDLSLPDEEPDTISPTLLSFFPDGSDIEFEVDSKVEVSFSEIIDESSLSGDEGIRLYSGDFVSFDEENPVYLRDSSFVASVKQNEGNEVSPVNNQRVDQDSTNVELTMPNGRFALNNSYSVVVGKSIKDLVEDDPSTEVDERNYFGTDKAITFITEPGSWHFKGDAGFVGVNRASDIGEILGATKSFSGIESNKAGDVFSFHVVDNDGSELWVSKLSTESYRWLSSQAQELDEGCLIDISPVEQCVNAVRINRDNFETITKPKLVINESRKALMVWLQPETGQQNAALWYSQYLSDGQWSNPVNLSSVFLNSSASVDLFDVSLSENGWASIVWRESSAGNYLLKNSVIKTAEIESQITATAPITLSISTDSANESFNNLKLIIPNDNKQVIIWREKNNNVSSLWSNEASISKVGEAYEVSHGISLPVENYTDTFSSIADENTIEFDAALNSKGDIGLAWKKSDGDLVSLWLSEYVSGSWLTARLAERNQQGSVAGFDLDFSSTDTLGLAWSFVISGNASDTQLKFREYHSNKGFGDIETFDIEGVITEAPRVHYDFEGNIMLLWKETRTQIDEVYFSYYSKISKQWSSASSLSENTRTGSLSNVSISPMFQDGRFVSTWLTHDIESSVKYAVFREN